MKIATRAALFSGLICPGCGHLLLKCYWRGGALLALTLTSLGVITTIAIQQARTIADKIASGAIPLDPDIIATKVEAAANGGGSALSHAASWLLLACWFVGIVDAYRLGKQQERAHAMAATAE